MILLAKYGWTEIWLIGKDTKIHALSHVVHYGTSVFEGNRAYDNKKAHVSFV